MNTKDQIVKFVTPLAKELQLPPMLVHLECQRAAKKLNIQWIDADFAKEDIVKITNVVRLKYKK